MSNRWGLGIGGWGLGLRPLALGLAVVVSVLAAEEPQTPPVLTGDLDFTAVETLAVQAGHRKQPLRTFAVENLEQITGRPLMASEPTVKDPETGQRLSATDALLSMWFETRDWSKMPVVLVAYGPLRRELGLSENESRFSDDDLVKSARLHELLESARGKQQRADARPLDALEEEAQAVAQRIQLLRRLRGGLLLDLVPYPTDPDGPWLSPALLRLLPEQPEVVTGLLAETKYGGDAEKAEAVVSAYQKGYSQAQIKDVLGKLAALAEAYRQRQAAAFASASEELRASLAALNPSAYPKDSTLALEVQYSRLRPFGKAWPLYLAAAVLMLLTWRARSRLPYVLTWCVFGLGIAFQIYGFALRCWIGGRAPVSNMYESVVWVALTCAAFGAVFEAIYRRRYFLVCGAVGAGVLLLIMDLLPVLLGDPHGSGYDSRLETYRSMAPILQSNFWLTVHVLTITTGYAAFALAWLLGHVTLYKHLVHPGEDAQMRELHGYIYQVLKAGLLLHLIGTLLGGIWAHYAWGRFWGWDNKETWALITLICYLVVLHGRFTGWWGEFAFAVGAVVCFQAVVMAWYGVNFILGSKLHSYGTGSGGLLYVGIIVGIDLLFAVAATVRHLTAGGNRRTAGEPQMNADERR